jgi:hypothetical protein
MTGGADLSICDFCKQGSLVERTETISFHQWSHRGIVFCKVAIPIETCDVCGATAWGEAAESIIEDAVRRAIEKLP